MFYHQSGYFIATPRTDISSVLRLTCDDMSVELRPTMCPIPFHKKTETWTSDAVTFDKGNKPKYLEKLLS
jgi:hypothetical protein